MENITLENYLEALANTGCSDNEKLRQASEFIESAKEKAGFCEAMMKIASNPEYNQEGGFDVNLAAAIQLKNMAQYHWMNSQDGQLGGFNDFDDEEPVEETKGVIISQEDKEFVKTNIIQACAHAPSFAVLALFEEIVLVVAKFEMPDRWPNAMTEITDLIQHGEEGKVFGGLTALKQVVKRFEFEFKQNRVSLDEIVDTLFPTIENMLVNLMDNMGESAMKAKNIIMNTLYLANNAKICKRYRDSDNFNSLMSVAFKGLTQEIPEEFTTPTESTDIIDKLNKNDFWMLKKKCITLLNRVMIQLFKEDEAEDDLKALSKIFLENHSKELIDIAFLILDLSLTKFVASEVVSCAVRIINRTDKAPNLLAIVLERHEDIVFKYSIPLLYLSPHDIEEFTENPVSYTRELYSLKISSLSARSYAIDMINYFVTYKENEKDESVPPYLEKFLTHCVETMSQPSEDFRIKESIMLAIGHLAPHILPYESLHAGVENILKDHIFPELQGDNDFLKARALWVYGEMPIFVKDSHHAVEAVSNTYKCLLDECIPVKVLAGTSLHKLSKIKEAREILEPGIDKIIEAYLKIMQEIDQDELVNGLEEIINLFDDKVAPFAFELIQELNNKFIKIAESNADSLSDATLAGNACLSAICRILSAVSKDKDLLCRIEEIIYPSILLCLTEEGLDFIDDCLDIPVLVVYHRKLISEKMWDLYFKKFRMALGDENDEEECENGGIGFEFVPVMMSFFQNCVSFGGESFFNYQIEGVTPFQLMVKSIGRIITIERNVFPNVYSTSVCAMKLMGTILENHIGKIDEVLPDFIKLLHSELEANPTSKIYRSSILQTFSICFVYDTSLTYKCLEEQHISDPMLKFFFSSMGSFTKTYEIRRVLYGIASIISSDLTKAPELLKSETSAIMNVVVVLINAYVNAKEKEIKQELTEASQMKVIESQGLEEVDDVKEILTKLKEIKQNEGKLMDFGLDVGEDDDDEADELIFTAGDLELYDSPLEKVDAPIYFKNIMSELQTMNPDLYNTLTGFLSKEQNDLLAKSFEKNEMLLNIEKE